MPDQARAGKRSDRDFRSYAFYIPEYVKRYLSLGENQSFNAPVV